METHVEESSAATPHLLSSNNMFATFLEPLILRALHPRKIRGSRNVANMLLGEVGKIHIAFFCVKNL